MAAVGYQIIYNNAWAWDFSKYLKKKNDQKQQRKKFFHYFGRNFGAIRLIQLIFELSLID